MATELEIERNIQRNTRNMKSIFLFAVAQCTKRLFRKVQKQVQIR